MATDDTIVPFPSSIELCKELHLSTDTETHSERDQAQLTSSVSVGESSSLLGEPLIPLNSPETPSHIQQELLTPALDSLSPYLWLVSTQSSDHISPLHQQLVKGRSIVIAENPELHLTWIYNRVFLKPIPPFLLSWAFWRFYLTSPHSPLGESRIAVHRAAVGFLRSYFFLIRHSSDFKLATQHDLLPDNISYFQIRTFLACFSELPDQTVSARYAFGELRLARVNFWGRLFQRRFALQKVQVHYSYSLYFARFYGPLLFVFAIFSTILSAMQVNLNVLGLPESEIPTPQRTKFMKFCLWFSVVSIFVAAMSSVLVGALIIGMFCREFVFALRARCGTIKELPNNGV
ncbi:hypothetical protein EJ08DRAFT_641674 [Tothia fuscella]|uniref:Uncharacterized protein n=1 Tax=Tothia fuscella TaxID=1048955 RepID=A0A9P4NHC2_9PEZI|nr:hypothetical protein EJ08DRAFT_641674 [Tothia fuscella]